MSGIDPTKEISSISARRIANNYGKDFVLIAGFDAGRGTMDLAWWGRTPELKAAVERFGELVYASFRERLESTGEISAPTIDPVSTESPGGLDHAEESGGGREGPREDGGQGPDGAGPV